MSNSISADQVAAGQLGQNTRFASIQIGSPDAGSSGHGPGLSLAWNQRGKPVAGLDTPVRVFHKLFSADDLPLEQRQAAIAEKRSVLDAVVTEANRVQRGLTKTDTDKLDEYFQGIRDIETRLSRDEEWLDVPKAKPPIEEPSPGLKGREGGAGTALIDELSLSGLSRIPNDRAHVVPVVAFNLPGIVGREDLAVLELNTAGITAVTLEIDDSERFAPSQSLIVTETDIDSLRRDAVAI